MLLQENGKRDQVYMEKREEKHEYRNSGDMTEKQC